MDIYATHTHTHTQTHTHAPNHVLAETRTKARARALSLSLSLSLSHTHTHSHTRTQAFRSRRSRVSRLARLARAALSTFANARSAPMPSAAAFSLSVSLAADGSYAAWACPGPYVTGYSHPPMAMAADTFGSDACFRP